MVATTNDVRTSRQAAIGKPNSAAMQQNRADEESSDWASRHRMRRSFQERDHGLTLSASHLAACAGFNPFRNLPELVLQLVYQGDEGRELQRHDARLLGLELVSDEANLRRIAERGGASTLRAVENALLVQKQRKTLKTTDAVNLVHQNAIQEAQKSGKLSHQELAVLNEGVRSAVFKGFGISHESSALDWYEENYCGCPVTERNSETKYWAFVRDDSSPHVPSVVPVHPRLVSDRERRGPSSSEQSAAEADRSDVDSGRRLEAVASASSAEKSLPFFIIAGKIDGVRDEMVPCNADRGGAGRDDADEDDDDSSWVMRRVVVECKHRIRQLRTTIPVYEVIQTTAYCYMFDAKVADLVQVLRKSKRARTISRKRSLNPGVCREEKPKTKKDDIRKYFTATLSSRKDRLTINAEAEYFGSDGSHAPGVTVETVRVPTVRSEGTSCDQSTTSTFLTSQSVADAVARALTYVNLVGGQGSSMGMENCAGKDLDGPFKFDPLLLQWREAGEILLKFQTILSEGRLINMAGDGDDSKSEAVKASDSPFQRVVLADDGDGQSVNDHNDESEVCMSVIRLDLDDPVLQPTFLWHRIVLPRLRMFVDAVYRIRRDDEKRYRLLQCASSSTVDSSQSIHAWSLLHHECPWLLDCDTAYHREKVGTLKEQHPSDGTRNNVVRRE